ncbi:unnamed protein product [Litomosoides sigmodontis]|uniref:Uncharacterized protein n=1 Tax=Litomosoides sigmodontis TaxID=42156 RepID=A0A3P6VE57_LITSI|nr:unnamed protein product [Litomosoides sigmodontis]
MDDPARAVVTTASGSNSGSDTHNVQICPPAQSLGNTNARSFDFPDLTDFVDRRTENELNELFADRYTMANKLYAEVGNGFPDPIVVYPWSETPKRNFDYVGRHQSWREEKRQNIGSEWRNRRENSKYPYLTQESRKRHYPTTSVFYPGRTNPKKMMLAKKT